MEYRSITLEHWVHLDRSTIEIYNLLTNQWEPRSFKGSLISNNLYRFHLDPLNPQIDPISYFITKNIMEVFGNEHIECIFLESQLEILCAKKELNRLYNLSVKKYGKKS